MKVIGRVGEEYLATIDINEIAKLMGYRDLYDDRWQKYLENAGIKSEYGKPITPNQMEGFIIDVLGYARRVSAIEEAQRKAQDSIKSLRGLADAAETAWPALVMIKEPTESEAMNSKSSSDHF